VVASANTDVAARDIPRAEAFSAPAPVADAAAGPVAGVALQPGPLAKADAATASEADAKRRARSNAAALMPVVSRPDSLQAAADRGDVDALKALLAAPAARVDALDADGRTALLHAVLAQRPAAVRLLLAAGADPGRADHAGLTPRQAAQGGANAEIAALLGATR
jgi:ankyrin repeat protein